MSLIVSNRPKETAGERIKRLRENMNMTQLELATKIGTSKQNISRYEKGVVENIPIRKIDAIARALGTTYEYLTTGFDSLSDVVVYYDEGGNAHSDVIGDDRQKLHRIIDAASDEQLELIERLLSLPTEQIEALAALLRAGR